MTEGSGAGPGGGELVYFFYSHQHSRVRHPVPVPIVAPKHEVLHDFNPEQQQPSRDVDEEPKK